MEVARTQVPELLLELDIALEDEHNMDESGLFSSIALTPGGAAARRS